MPDKSPAKILIVDDEAAQMKALCDTLKDHGYATTGLVSARDALALLREQRFDLLLTDLMMPEMDGITLLRSALETDGDLVGVMMTGQGTIDTAVEAMKAGALDYILKPFKLSFILPVLSRALAVRRLRLENAALQQRIRERTAELEAANKELDAFAHTISHDLRAPLRHIHGFVSFLEESATPKLDEEERRQMTVIKQAAQRMSQLIDDLLAFSRIGRMEIHKERVGMDALVRETLEQMQPDLPGRNIVWNVLALPEVTGNRNLLRQVWVNLLSNAVKYSRPRDPARIEVDASVQGGETIFHVRDNGIGFSMEYVDKLFGVFKRLHSNSEFEGTGIGLANVRRIVHRHGGRTWAESVEGEGATFYFSLPAG